MFRKIRRQCRPRQSAPRRDLIMSGWMASGFGMGAGFGSAVTGGIHLIPMQFGCTAIGFKALTAGIAGLVIGDELGNLIVSNPVKTHLD
jgi:hypothetical protein